MTRFLNFARFQPHGPDAEGRKDRYEDGTPHFANPSRKTRWNDRQGEERGEGGARTGWGERREREIGIGKNKVNEGGRERERHAKQVSKRVSRSSIFLWPLPRATLPFNDAADSCPWFTTSTKLLVYA